RLHRGRRLHGRSEGRARARRSAASADHARGSRGAHGAPSGLSGGRHAEQPTMKEITLTDVERAIQTVAATALKNEKYFSELDSAAGDADFGVSLAAGFRVVQKDWEQLDRSSIGNFLLKISMIITRNVGGCSGPIWGTGFMRAAACCRDKSAITLADLEKMLTSAIEGIQQRGGAVAGDKTLLDALLPVRDTLREHASRPDADAALVLREATRVATEAIEGTK